MSRRYLALAVIALFSSAIMVLFGLSIYRHVMKGLYPIKYGADIQTNAALYGVDPFLVAAVIRVESGFDSSGSSSKGASGLMQIVPATGRWIADKLDIPYTNQTLIDPTLNVKMGTWYLAELHREFSSWTTALVAYNAGRGNVRRWLALNKWTGRYDDADEIPFLETRVYIRRVVNAHRWYRRIYQEQWPKQ